MRRCTSCFRFQPGRPTYCAYCGRSFDVRLCPRGHRSPRHVEFCAECGSADLSTPSPAPSALHRVSGALLYLVGAAVLVIVVCTVALALLQLVDFEALGGPLLGLLVMLGFLYWTTTLLPGPVKRLGRSAARHAWRSTRRKRGDRHE
jgi:hypothetical protein